MLLGKICSEITISIPSGATLKLALLDTKKEEMWASAAVKKESGDDPDITNGVLVYSKVYWCEKSGIFVDGGFGVGRVTKSGLDCSVGSAAINSVPRKMIIQQVERALKEKCSLIKYPNKGIQVIISIPEGEALAKKTYNPRLGIVGGLSILGTSGVVEPMSHQALIDTTRLEMNVLHNQGKNNLVLTPGNYGETFIQKYYGNKAMGILSSQVVKYSNFLGEALDNSVELGFQNLLIIGHIGKLVKVAGGIMNTHSKYADCRMEILTAHCGIAGGNTELLSKLMLCLTTDEALGLLKEEGLLEATMKTLMGKIYFHIENRLEDKLCVAAIVFSNTFGVLGETQNTQKILEEIYEENSRK